MQVDYDDDVDDVDPYDVLSEESGSDASDGEDYGGRGYFVRHDLSSLQLKEDHQKRPLWVTKEGHVFLETFQELYQRAYDFLIAIADPVSRPPFVHKYQITKYSLYAAASLGLLTDDIIGALEMFSKVELDSDFVTFVRMHTQRAGKVKLVLRKNRFYVESIHVVSVLF